LDENKPTSYPLDSLAESLGAAAGERTKLKEGEQRPYGSGVFLSERRIRSDSMALRKGSTYSPNSEWRSRSSLPSSISPNDSFSVVHAMESPKEWHFVQRIVRQEDRRVDHEEDSRGPQEPTGPSDLEAQCVGARPALERFCGPGCRLGAGEQQLGQQQHA
jgi:hypothetical protein